MAAQHAVAAHPRLIMRAPKGGETSGAAFRRGPNSPALRGAVGREVRHSRYPVARTEVAD